MCIAYQCIGQFKWQARSFLLVQLFTESAHLLVVFVKNVSIDDIFVRVCN